MLARVECRTWQLSERIAAAVVGVGSDFCSRGVNKLDVLFNELFPPCSMKDIVLNLFNLC
jgi:hypothetical protein